MRMRKTALLLIGLMVVELLAPTGDLSACSYHAVAAGNAFSSGDSSLGDIISGLVSGNASLDDILSGLTSGNATGSGDAGTNPTIPPEVLDQIKDAINGNGGASGNQNQGNNSNSSNTIPGTKVTGLKVVRTGVDSITLSWNKASDANWYVISYWPTGSASAEQIITTVGDVNEYTIGNLTQNEYAIYVMPANRTETGELKYSRLLNSASLYCCPLAKKPSKVAASNILTGYASFRIMGLGATDTSFYDSEAELYDASGNKLGVYYGQPDNIAISDTRIKKNRFYKVRIRGYYQLKDGTKLAGEWSNYKYFSVGLKKVSGAAGKNAVSLSWSKVKGASSYVVYLKKSGASDYKKVKTVSGKKTSCKVNKYGKKKLGKNTVYYIKVYAVMKKNNKTYQCKSEVYKVRTKK